MALIKIRLQNVLRGHPSKRLVFIHRLKNIGFTGPASCSRYELILYANHRLSFPLNTEYSVSLVSIMVDEEESIVC